MKKTTSISIGSDATVREGSSVLLRCPVRMYGPVDIMWKKDGQLMNIRQRRHGDILFKTLDVEDSGEYTCYSRDRAKVKFGTVTLNVIGTTLLFIFLKSFNIFILNSNFYYLMEWKQLEYFHCPWNPGVRG